MNQSEEERKRKRHEALDEYKRIVSYEIPAGLAEPHSRKKKRFLSFRKIVLPVIILLTAFCYFYAGKQLSDTDAANKALEKELSASNDNIEALKLELEAAKNAPAPEMPDASEEEPESACISPDSFSALYPLTAGSVITCSYGFSSAPDGTESFCRGLELQTEPDAKVIAAAGGTILFAGEDEETGLTIRIDHSGGYISHYCRLRELQVTAGQTVTAGESIALPAYTETDNLSHMEFRITYNGTYINPEDVMNING